MGTEYRLAARTFGKVHYFNKRDLTHAEKGLDDLLSDFLTRQSNYIGADAEAWIEKRKVGDWKAVDLDG